MSFARLRSLCNTAFDLPSNRRAKAGRSVLNKATPPMTPIDSNPVSRFFTPPARFLAILSGWWLIALSFLTVAEILLRKFFSISLQGVDEIGGYTTAIVSAFGFASALMIKAHTRVDFLLGRMPALLRAVLNATAYALLAGMAIYGAWRGWSVLEESIEFQAHANSPLQTPLWLPQGAWMIGLVLFALSAGAMAAHAFWLLLSDRARLNLFYGPLTLDEEIEAEMGTILEREGKQP
jgi:TRAP-type C4-dicarboxylate transport system permease small subunit